MGTWNFIYDAEGQRIRKAAGSTVEEYVYDSAGHQFAAMQPNTAVTRVEFYASARNLATYDRASNATYFIHGDWQGTERMRTNVIRRVLRDLYEPAFRRQPGVRGRSGHQPHALYRQAQPRCNNSDSLWTFAVSGNHGLRSWPASIVISRRASLLSV